MRRPIAIAAAVGTLLAGGTAVAAGGRPFFGPDKQDRDAELAKELAKRLDGVTADQIQKALDDVRNDKRAEMRKRQAEDIAKHLDGVSVAEVEKALSKIESSAPRHDLGPGGRDHRMPHRVDFAAELAKALGKKESDVRKALQASAKEQFEARIDQAVTDGKLTKKQANRMKKRFESGQPFFFRGKGHGHREFGFERRFHGPGPGPGLRGGPPPGPVGPGGFDTMPAPPPDSL